MFVNIAHVHLHMKHVISFMQKEDNDVKQWTKRIKTEKKKDLEKEAKN